MTTKVVIKNLLSTGKNILQNVVAKTRFGRLPGAENKITPKPDVSSVQKIGKQVVPQKGSVVKRGFPDISSKIFYGLLRSRNLTQLNNKYGRHLRPTFAFGFAGLAFHSKLETEQSQNENLSAEVRKIFNHREGKHSLLEHVQELSLDIFGFGQLIGQGCNAAVYEAKINTPLEDAASDVTLDTDAESDIVVLNSDGDTDSFHGDEALVAEDAVIGFTLDTDAESDIVVLNSDGDTDSCFGDEALVDSFVMIKEERFSTIRENMSDDNSSTVLDDMEETFEKGDVAVVEEYNLAIKMMYNYDVESNAEAIMRVMQKEAVPAIMKAPEDVWDDRSKVRLKSLPPHPNIVEMLGVFVDPVPVLPGALSQYPAALPQRLNPSGLGRNKTMFIVMKKYTGGTLRDYLTNEEPSVRTRCLLLAQLLEGVGHLQRHGVAHRDLKSDNIFIGNTNGCCAPQLVIGDFGCCLAEVDNDLTLAYTTSEMDRGGNPALMPPEIKCAVPGKNVVLDYKKYDVFTLGSLVYEIFGCENPFYKKTDGEKKLDSRYYDEADLPSLPDEVPDVIKFLTWKILSRDPRQRPSPTLAANLLQMYLYFPEWLLPENKPVYKTVKKAIILMTAELLFIQRYGGKSSQTVDNQLKLTFLARLDISQIVNCIEIFHSNL